MIARLFFYSAHAIRRAVGIPSRTALAFVSVVIAWMALQLALVELQNIEDLKKKSGTLDGFPGYRLSVAKTLRRSISSQPNLLPRTFIERLRASSLTFAFQLRDPTTASDFKISRHISADLLFVVTKRGELNSDSSFPRCSLIEPSLRKAQHAHMLVVARNWRCLLTPLPSSLSSLAEGRTTNALILPLSSINEVAGRQALNFVTTIWLSLENQASLTELIPSPREAPKFELQVIPLGAGKRSDAADLSMTTKILVGAAGGFLLLGLGLYVHGVFTPIRNEATLRICVGQKRRTVLCWMCMDVLTQSFVLEGMACLVATLILSMLHENIPFYLLNTTLIWMSATIGITTFFSCSIFVLYLFRLQTIFKLTKW